MVSLPLKMGDIAAALKSLRCSVVLLFVVCSDIFQPSVRFVFCVSITVKQKKRTYRTTLLGSLQKSFKSLPDAVFCVVAAHRLRYLSPGHLVNDPHADDPAVMTVLYPGDEVMYFIQRVLYLCLKS